jgi:hypothetical protein
LRSDCFVVDLAIDDHGALQQLYDTQEIHTLLSEARSVDHQLQELDLAKQRFTPSQAEVYNYIHDKISAGEQVLAFITGPGGTGKSFLLKALKVMLEVVLMQNVAVTASSGSHFCYVCLF